MKYNITIFLTGDESTVEKSDCSEREIAELESKIFSSTGETNQFISFIDDDEDKWLINLEQIQCISFEEVYEEENTNKKSNAGFWFFFSISLGIAL